MERALQLGLSANLPGVLPFTVRRVAAMEGDEPVQTLAETLASTTDPLKRLELMKGLNTLIVAEQ